MKLEDAYDKIETYQLNTAVKDIKDANNLAKYENADRILKKVLLKLLNMMKELTNGKNTSTILSEHINILNMKNLYQKPLSHKTA